MTVDDRWVERFRDAQARNRKLNEDVAGGERTLEPGGGGGDSGGMDGIAARVTRVEGRLDLIEHRLGAVEERMSRLEGRMDRLDARMDGIDTRLRGVEQTLAAVNGNWTFSPHRSSASCPLDGRCRLSSARPSPC